MAEEELQDDELEEFEDDEKKPGKAKLIIALALSAVLGVGGGSFVVPSFFGGSDAAAESSAPSEGESNDGHGAPPEIGNLYSVSNLVVNARGSEGNRLLVATVAIEVGNEEELSVLRERDIQIRDEITTVLESIPMGILIRLGARDTVKQRVALQLEHYVEGPMRVYVPQFVLQ